MAGLRTPPLLHHLAAGVGTTGCSTTAGCISAASVAALFLTAVPVTHAYGGHLLFGSSHWNPRETFVRGGSPFLVLQTLAWASWAVSLLSSLWVVLSPRGSDVAGLPVTELAGAAICVAVLSQVLMVSSLLSFQERAAPPARAAPPPAPGLAHRRSSSEALSYDFGWEDEPVTSEARSTQHRRAASAASPPQSPRVAATVAAAAAAATTLLELLRGRHGAMLTAALGGILALTGHGLALSVALNAVASAAARLLFAAVAGLLFAVAPPLSHGLAGKLRHGTTPGGWRFWQPGRGGLAFILVQVLGWMAYATSLLASAAALYLSHEALMGPAPAAPPRRLTLPAAFWLAGAAGTASQVLLAASLLCFRPTPAPPPAEPRQVAAMLAVLLMVYAPCHLLIAGVASLFLTLPSPAAAALLAAAGAAYARTYAGHPAHTGARTWPRFQAYCGEVLSVALAQWFGSVAVRRHPAGAPPPPPGGPVVFGYHPHGMYPAAAAWFHHTPQWRAACPGVAPVTLGASAIFYTPLLRDVVMWSGARCVSRRAVRQALQEEGRPIVLCPGGQAELVEHRAGAATVLCTRHRGFIRCALEAGAPLCPVFVFGEAQAQRNLLSHKRLQRWTTRRLGFPFPFLPGGYLRVLPLPEPVPLTFVIGPLLPPPPRPPGTPPSDADIDVMHARYYAALVECFETHKAAAGFPHATLVLKDD